MTRRLDSPNGFTLVEVLVGAALSAIVMAALLSSFVFLGRSLTRLTNYQTLEAKGRQALTSFRADCAQAQSVKSGTTPTATTLTLVVPSGEITYTYDGAGLRLHRQANFGSNQDSYLLQNDYCSCTSFSFNYYTTTNGAPTSQVTPSLNVPYSIKEIHMQFVLQTPGTGSPATLARYQLVSSRVQIRIRPAPDGN